MSISFIVLLTSRHNPILHKNELILPESKYHGQIYVMVDLALDMKPWNAKTSAGYILLVLASPKFSYVFKDWYL